ncbi:MAG TPA: polyphosphate kinase 1, partial [Longimicrobiales bacterium]|nr:polyphosphate kinase 1 [Longimicrobiales bacterium]
FFMSRVGAFKRLVAAGDEHVTMDGLTPGEQLDVIAIRARQIMSRAYGLLNNRLLPDLEQEGVAIERWADLGEEDREYVRHTYGDQLEALITPLASDPTHPFPHIRNLRPALAAMVRLSESRSEHFVAVELPGDLPRFVPLPGARRFVPLEDVVEASLSEIYAGLEVVRAHTFRVTRSAKINLDNEPLDMLQRIEEEVTRRPFQEVVRLEVERSMPPEMRAHLLRELQFQSDERQSTLGEEDVYTVDRLVDLAALEELASLDLPRLRFGPLERHRALDTERGVFEQIAERERLVHFPWDEFETSVERFLMAAAEDPDVVGVKVTVYRTARDSAVVAALRRARENGKDAVAMVELKASFDEQRNIEWARGLEAAGIRVVFSPPRFKVHAKIALVVRREGEQLRRYAYIGTGNLNATTAATYVDVGLFTADPALTQEVNGVFNLLTGYSAGADFAHLLVAPLNMRRRFLALIEREAEHARAGRGGLIRGQLNGLADRRLIGALYHASQAGVEIDLMVREICSLRPGVPGVSENIRVTSLMGRFLQHARIFHFGNGGEPEYFIGSADWRPRNMRERVEVATPVRDPEHRRRLSAILDQALEHPDSWEIRSDGTYVRAGDVIGGRRGGIEVEVELEEE